MAPASLTQPPVESMFVQEFCIPIQAGLVPFHRDFCVRIIPAGSRAYYEFMTDRGIDVLKFATGSDSLRAHAFCRHRFPRT